MTGLELEFQLWAELPRLGMNIIDSGRIYCLSKQNVKENKKHDDVEDYIPLASVAYNEDDILLTALRRNDADADIPLSAFHFIYCI